MFSIRYQARGKRIVDVIVGLSMSVISLPLFATLAVLIRWQMGGPVIFRQPRPGKDGLIFYLYKLRTMTDERDANGHLLPDEQRLTALGKLLRSTSLDELPTFFNVLRGEMSLVGPRPLLVDYLPRYTAEQMRRHEVRPGITGWAQVNGRNSLSWEEKFKLDIWYVDHLSFLVDLKILFLTVIKVFRREGISQAGHATMEEFFGTQRGMNA
ncbi:MAG: sugar transferase [Caldilineaceae bacterium]|nr:sugar transferase [Caldilineaceae bacterium]MCB0127921.1 sugar transferase [Caldilineaceae bacterium]